MAFNKNMHPRSIYRTPPNFKQMAINYPEFRKYIKQDITGKVSIDFKDKDTLRVLSQTLLKKDFNLDVIIPPDRLIPTVPLRLNYILWIEDLLSVTTENFNHNNIQGIDIGTGASCVYPLIAAKQYNWHMTATEIDVQSLNTAQENVNRNNLQHLIFVLILANIEHKMRNCTYLLVKQNTGNTFLKDILDPSINYDFCMCNPPFFSKTKDLDPKFKSRSEKRPLPRNARSGILSEVISQGGEVEFISKLIHESVEIKDRIRIFTSMVGQKSSLPPLKALLRSVEATCFKETEFHQGHTTRWCLAWTFLDIDLRKVPKATLEAGKKKIKPLTFVLPNVTPEIKLIDIITKIRLLLQQLHMDYEEIKRTQYTYGFEVKARENTWSHQRRRRRQQNRKQNGSGESSNCEIEFEMKETEKLNNSLNETGSEANSSKEESQMDVDTSTESNLKRSREESDDEEMPCTSKKMKEIDDATVYLKFMLIIRQENKEFHLEMFYLEGSAGKEAVHQVLQYFKNNYK